MLKGRSKAAHICCCSHWQLRYTRTHIAVLSSCMGSVPAFQSFGKPAPALHIPRTRRGVAVGSCSFSLRSLLLLAAPTLLCAFAHFPKPFPAPDEFLECHACLNTPVPCSTLPSVLPLAAPHLSAQGKPDSSSEDTVNPQAQSPPRVPHLFSTGTPSCGEVQGLSTYLTQRRHFWFLKQKCCSKNPGSSQNSGWVSSSAAAESELDMHQEQTIYLVKTWSLTWKNPTSHSVHGI